MIIRNGQVLFPCSLIVPNKVDLAGKKLKVEVRKGKALVISSDGKTSTIPPALAARMLPIAQENIRLLQKTIDALELAANGLDEEPENK